MILKAVCITKQLVKNPLKAAIKAVLIINIDVHTLSIILFYVTNIILKAHHYMLCVYY